MSAALVSVRRPRWLGAARLACLVLALVTLAVYLLAIPARYAELRAPCVAAASVCADAGLPTAEDARQLAASGLSLDFYAAFWVGVRVLMTTVYGTVALLMFARRPDNRMALFVSLFLLLFGMNNGMLPALVRLAPGLQQIYQLWQLLPLIGFALFLACFPNGRFVPGAMRWVVLVWAVGIAIGQFFPALLTGTSEHPASTWIGAVGWLGLYLSGGVAQVWRYWRVSTVEERYQTKWVVSGIVILVAGVLGIGGLMGYRSPLEHLSPGTLALDFAGNGLLVAALPVSIGIAMLRSRLYDIDLIIRRTLIYSVLTGLLALAYFGLVVVLENILRIVTGNAQNQFATVVSTLAIAAFFTPLRARVQAFIDRRFFRQKYDAARTLAAFALSARDDVDLDDLTGRLVGVVDETLQPATVGLWLRPVPQPARPGGRQ